MNKEQNHSLQREKEIFKNVMIAIFYVVFTLLVIAVIF